MKPTKEELQKQITTLDQSNKYYADHEKTLRHEFSIVLGAPTNFKYGTSETHVYTWEQIFTEVGKLLARDTILRLKEEINAIQIPNRGKGRYRPI